MYFVPVRSRVFVSKSSIPVPVFVLVGSSVPTLYLSGRSSVKLDLYHFGRSSLPGPVTSLAGPAYLNVFIRVGLLYVKLNPSC